MMDFVWLTKIRAIVRVLCCAKSALCQCRRVCMCPGRRGNLICNNNLFPPNSYHLVTLWVRTKAPCLPEIYCQFASLPMMRRSFLIQALFAPIQKKGMDLTRNESLKFYKAYLDRSKAVDQLLRPVCMTFNKFAHEFRMDKGVAAKRRLATGQIIAVGARFSYELLDIYISQFCTMFSLTNISMTSFLLATTRRSCRARSTSSAR